MRGLPGCCEPADVLWGECDFGNPVGDSADSWLQEQRAQIFAEVRSLAPCA